MDHATRGIILRTYPFSETSLIVRWLTPDHGRIATVARGALRPKSAFRGRLDLYYLAQFTFTPSRRSTLHTLKEISLCDTFKNLRQNYAALEHAAYATRLIERITETDTPLPGMFELLDDFLRLARKPSSAQFHVAALELRLLDWSGQIPNLETADLSPGARSLCQQLLHAPASLRRQLQPSSGQAQEIHRFLQTCLQAQFDIPSAWRSTALGRTG